MAAQQKIFVKYDATGILVAGTVVSAYQKPNGSGWREIPKNLCCTNTDFPQNNRGLAGFVRLDQSGNVVPGSLIIRKKYPEHGRWLKVPYKLCCND